MCRVRPEGTDPKPRPLSPAQFCFFAQHESRYRPLYDVMCTPRSDVQKLDRVKAARELRRCRRDWVTRPRLATPKPPHSSPPANSLSLSLSLNLILSLSNSLQPFQTPPPLSHSSISVILTTKHTTPLASPTNYVHPRQRDTLPARRRPEQQRRDGPRDLTSVATKPICCHSFTLCVKEGGG